MTKPYTEQHHPDAIWRPSPPYRTMAGLCSCGERLTEYGILKLVESMRRHAEMAQGAANQTVGA